MLTLFSAMICAQTGCSTLSNEPPRKTIPGLFDHFKSCGFKVGKVENVLYQAVKASDGIVMYIDGAKVEVYDYNLKLAKQKRRVEQIAKTGKMNILTIPVPAVVNGNLVMLTYTRHPKIHEIIKAFKSF
ncbi:MAG: hypothetical protein GXP32_01125 [Kiritimatiellaeota bacterium]|nr:hypothetical protein [Kiritimatiellota bacterium]